MNFDSFIHSFVFSSQWSTMRIFLILSVLSAFDIQNILSDNMLRLYDTFAEVHQIYNEPLRFQQSDWDNIKQESIIIRQMSNNNNNNMSITFERRIVRVNMNMTGDWNK